MTAAFASGHRQENRAEQLESLRRRMAGVSGKMSGQVAARADDLLPESESQLALPQWLADSLPVPLPRGTVGVLSGARSLLLSMVAAVTAAEATRLSSANRISDCWPPRRWGRI